MLHPIIQYRICSLAVWIGTLSYQCATKHTIHSLIFSPKKEKKEEKKIKTDGGQLIIYCWLSVHEKKEEEEERIHWWVTIDILLGLSCGWKSISDPRPFIYSTFIYCDNVTCDWHGFGGTVAGDCSTNLESWKTRSHFPWWFCTFAFPKEDANKSCSIKFFWLWWHKCIAAVCSSPTPSQ